MDRAGAVADAPHRHLHGAQDAANGTTVKPLRGLTGLLAQSDATTALWQSGAANYLGSVFAAQGSGVATATPSCWSG